MGEDIYRAGCPRPLDQTHAHRGVAGVTADRAPPSRSPIGRLKGHEGGLSSMPRPFGMTIGSEKVGNGSDLRHKCLEPELSGTARKETSTLPSAHVRIWHICDLPDPRRSRQQSV